MQNLKNELNEILGKFNAKMTRIYKNPMMNGEWYRNNLQTVAEEDVKPEFDAILRKYLTEMQSKVKPVKLKQLGATEFAEIGSKVALYKALNGSISTEFLKHLVGQYMDYELNELKALCVDVPNNPERELAFMEYEAQFKDLEAREQAYKHLEEHLTFKGMVRSMNGFLELQEPNYTTMLSVHNLNGGVQNA